VGCSADPWELLKLGFEVAESTVSKYMIGRCGPPSQSRERKKVETRFAHMKRILKFDRLRLRG
jgi:hypothetical protein